MTVLVISVSVTGAELEAEHEEKIRSNYDKVLKAGIVHRQY